MSHNISDIHLMLGRLAKLEQERAEEKKILDDIDADIALLRGDILIAMVNNKLKTVKNDYATVMVKPTASVVISDQHKVMDWLKENPDYDLETYLRLDKKMVDPIIKHVLTEDGEVVPGTEIVTAETISISRNKKDKTDE